jgi:hypothetical protein
VDPVLSVILVLGASDLGERAVADREHRGAAEAVHCRIDWKCAPYGA